MMKLNKRQKTFIGIFGIAFCGLICDRAFLLPQGAGADPLAEAVPEAAAGILDPVPSDPIGPNDAFGYRLQRAVPAASDRSARDAFVLSPSWLRSLESDVEDMSKAAILRDFTQHHQLKAVVLHNQVKAAYVDDAYVAVGEAIDGFTLVAVDAASATFAAFGKQVVLEFADDR